MRDKDKSVKILNAVQEQIEILRNILGRGKALLCNGEIGTVARQWKSPMHRYCNFAVFSLAITSLLVQKCSTYAWTETEGELQ